MIPNRRERDLKKGELEENLESWSLAVDFFSTPRTTLSVPRTPTAALPLRTASRAYSTWKRWPSGEKTVIARSYLAIVRALFLLLRFTSELGFVAPSVPLYSSFFALLKRVKKKKTTKVQLLRQQDK